MRSLFLVFALFLPTALVAAPSITKQSLASQGKERSYYLFVPSEPGPAAPLLVLLHGSGRSGKILVEHWRPFAEKNGIVLAGPDALESRQWQFPEDGPVFLRDVVKDVQSRTTVDGRRVYLFGHSAGASFAVPMALLQSKYFAAAAVHAGGLGAGNEDVLALAHRKVPVFLIVGARDASLGTARQTNELLKEKGHPVELVEMPRHGHDYYGRSREINEKAWEFLSAHALDREPAYRSYANIPE